MEWCGPERFGAERCGPDRRTGSVRRGVDRDERKRKRFGPERFGSERCGPGGWRTGPGAGWCGPDRLGPERAGKPVLDGATFEGEAPTR
jgi:hypothetical protein